MSSDTLDGHRFRRAVITGAEWVRRRRAHLNAINVYPVPDGDTGTNMALSLSAAAASIRDSEETHLARVLDAISEASVLGAKGNSGLILAHWFLGLRHAVGERSHVLVPELATALHRATDAVYTALENPVEGTILTVMRGASEAARGAAERGRGLLHLLDETIGGAEEALRRTPELLGILHEAHVVDAGGEGYLNLLQGMRRALHGGEVTVSTDLDAGDTHAELRSFEMEIPYRYCTEFVLRGKGFDHGKLRRRFEKFGDSLQVACTPTLAKVHVHTNQPREVFDSARRLGTIDERKVEDMQLQQKERLEGVDTGPRVPLEAQPKTVAIVCDSTADLPAPLREEWGIEMVPLQILFGDDVYRDQVDLSTVAFYERMAASSVVPSTSQPPPRAFVEAFERIREDRDVVVLTVSTDLSGTHASAYSAARLVPHRIEVVDSGSASMALGWLVYNAARLAKRGASLECIVAWCQRWRSGTGIVFALDTLEYLHRGGRIGTARMLLGSALGFKPVLTFADGAVRPVGRGRGERDVQDKLLEELERRIPQGSRLRVGVIHGPQHPDTTYVEETLRQRYEVVETVHTGCTGVVGCHAGPGGWGIAYQVVEEDDPLLLAAEESC